MVPEPAHTLRKSHSHEVRPGEPLTRLPHVHPQELVISIHQGQEYNRVEALVVAEEAASPLWTSDWNMPSIQRHPGHVESSTSGGRWTRPATNPLRVWGTTSPGLLPTFHSWTHGISHQGPIPLELSSDSLLQLLIELRRHLDDVSVCNRVIQVEPWHRSAVQTLFFKLCPG